jgi:hypothetical protein
MEIFVVMDAQDCRSADACFGGRIESSSPMSSFKQSFLFVLVPITLNNRAGKLEATKNSKILHNIFFLVQKCA